MDVYRYELKYFVLSCLIDISCKVSSVFSDAIPQSVDDFKAFTINFLQFAMEKLGWDPISGESHLNAMLRGNILEVLAQFGHEETKVEERR
jgi:puromycin-sensitive aminopeptidase